MTGEQQLELVFNAGVALAIVATVASLGLSLTVGELLAPLRRVGFMSVVIVVNAVVIPAAAWGISTVFGLSDDALTGVTLAAIGAAGAIGLKAAQLSGRADLALAVSAVVVLQVVNIVAVPAWAGAVAGATLSSSAILLNLLLLVLVPLVLGLMVRRRSGDRAARWHRILVLLGNLGLVVALIAGIADNRKSIVELAGSRVMLASIAIVALAIALGLLTGGRDPRARVAIGLVSGMRFAALGLIIIGTQLDARATVLGPAIVYALVDFVAAIAVALLIARRESATRAAAMG